MPAHPLPVLKPGDARQTVFDLSGVPLGLLKHRERRDFLSDQTRTLPGRIERVLRTIEALALADVNKANPSAKAKTAAMEQRVGLEEALERYQGELEAARGELEPLQGALAEKRHKLGQYVAFQVAE